MKWLLVASAVIGSAGALIVLLPAIYFGAGLLYLLATTQPPNWDVVVAKGSDCQLTDHPALRNNRGTEAILREANCPGDFAQGTSYNVVFIHAIGKANSRGNLAFQYTPGFEGNRLSPLPKLIWKGATLLEVTAPGTIEDIKVQKSEVVGVKVRYRLGE